MANFNTVNPYDPTSSLFKIERIALPIEEDVEFTFSDLDDYITYIEGEEYAISKGKDIKTLEEKFISLDHQEFLDIAINILRDLYNDKSNHTKNLKLAEFNFSSTHQFFSKYKMICREEDFTKIAEVLFLLHVNINKDKFFSLNRNDNSDLGIDFLVYSSLYIDKNVFKENYYEIGMQIIDHIKTYSKPSLYHQINEILFYTFTKNYQKLIHECDNLLNCKNKTYKEEIDCYFLRGRAKIKLNKEGSDKDLNKAIELINKVIENRQMENQSKLDLIILSGWGYLELGKIDNAITVCESIKLNPDFLEKDINNSSNLCHLLAKIDFTKNNFSEAYDEIRSALIFDPGFQQYLNLKTKIENIFKFNENLLRTKILHDTHFEYR